MIGSGDTILVTGGGSGIGRGLAEGLQALGNKVIIAGRREEQLKKVTEANPGMAAAVLDQSDPEAIAAFAAKIQQDHPDLNVVMNNAGVQHMEDLKRGDLADAEATITTNLLGPMRIIAALLPGLLLKPSAAVINVTSGLAFMPQAMTPTYCATKAALHSYTQSLRFQLRHTAVKVIEIVPPWVQTELQGARGNDPRAMPLADFLAETLHLLQQQPSLDEIVVEKASAFRLAERNGQFDEIFTAFNERRASEHGH